MIRINFTEPDTKKWKRWKKDCQEKTEELVESVRQGNKPEISNLYKRKSIKDEVYFCKQGPFHGKCAYCECYITDFQHGDIEHFRPKKGVTDEDDNPIMVKDSQGNEVQHPGYYWLAYDWKNLLPSCTDCNQPGVISGKKKGKHNRFPVNGTHAANPDEIKDEQPLLINPVADDPGEHLTIDIKTGLMDYRTEKGKMCIEIFALNLRNRLPEERKKACMHVQALAFQIISNLSDQPGRDKAVQELVEIKKGKRAYSMAGRAVIKDIAPCFVPVFEDMT